MEPAEEAETAQADSVPAVTAPARADALSVQIRGYLDHLTVERGAAHNTLTSYTRDLNRYGAYLRSVDVHDLADVTEASVAGFLADMRRGAPADGIPPLAASSAARALVAARGLHKFAAAERLIPADVAREVHPPRAGRRLPKALTVDEVLRLLEAAGGTGDAAEGGSGGQSAVPRGLRDRALLETLYSTGARISEAIALDVDDIDAETRSVILAGKGGKERIVPVGRPALAAIDAYLVRGRPALAKRGGAAMFLNARGGRLSRQSAWQVLQDAASRAGIAAGVSPHTLRHSFATHLLDGGADVRVVQELLGHASVSTTQVYTMVTVTALREVWAGAHPRAR